MILLIKEEIDVGKRSRFIGENNKFWIRNFKDDVYLR